MDFLSKFIRSKQHPPQNLKRVQLKSVCEVSLSLSKRFYSSQSTMKKFFAKITCAIRKVHCIKVSLQIMSFSMFALRVAVISLHYFLIDLPLNQNLNFFWVHRIFPLCHWKIQPQSPQKNNSSVGLLEEDDRDTSKGDRVCIIHSTGITLLFNFRKLQSKIFE